MGKQVLLDAANEYLKIGLHVMALTGKTPNVRVHRHGLKDAFLRAPEDANEQHLLYAAFMHEDTTGVGILTDWPLVVVDIDGEDGAQAWKELVGDSSFIPDRWAAKTGRGLHLYMGSVEPTGSMKLAPLLDLKGDGGYVAAPPSQHFDENGNPDHVYTWLLEPTAAHLMEMPDRLAQRIRAHNFDRDRRLVSAAQQKRVRHEQFEGGRLWASWGFDAVVKGMAEAVEGNRNQYLHWAAATLAEEGASDEDFEELRVAAVDAGLTALETRRTIRSARRKRE